MSVPALRFKQDDGQDYPEWEEKSFKEVSKINQGLQIPISERFAESAENRHFYITNEFLKKDAKNQYFIENPPSSVLCSESDVLMTRTGNTGKVVTNVKGAFHNNFFKIDYDKNILNKDFLCEFLCLDHTQSLILKLAGTSTIPDLNHSDFYKISIRFPSLPEQTKIANFLTAVDEKINQLTQKHDLLTQYKKGVMQQIFSQELRFKDDDGLDFPDWEVHTLGELSDVRDGTHDSPKFYSTGYPLITSKNLLDSGKLNLENVNLISEEDFNKINKRSKVDCGDILFGMIGTIGNPVVVRSSNFAIKNVALIKQQAKLQNNFLSQYLKSQVVLKQFGDMTVGNTQKFIALGKLRKLKVQLPSKTEQTKIANFLTAIDDKSTATQTQLKAVKQYKQGLLQQMFV